MTYKWLRRIRIIVALVFFLFTSLIFLDFRELLSSENVNSIVFLQFVPSILKFISILSLSAAGFIVIIVLTAFFGRVYCSAICPLGIFQDFISRVGRVFKRRKKRRYKYSKPLRILRNVILASVVVVSIFSVLLLNILDPYSLFGKMATGILRPVGVFVNNTVAGILEEMNIFFLHFKVLQPVKLAGLLIPVIIFLTLLYMAGRRGRLYCNTICPVGTLLGWISKISFFKIRMNQANCTQCGKCAVECKAECINIKEMTVDHSRCVACYNCLPVCNDLAITYSFRKKDAVFIPVTTSAESISYSESIKQTVSGRKKFLLAGFTGLLGMVGIRKVWAAGAGDDKPLNKKPTTVSYEKLSEVSPPGSLSVSHYNSVCTACQLCVSQCPTGVLQPSVIQFGLANYMQPFMDYSSNYCNFECIRCADVCPTGAILAIDVENKKTLQIGKVHFIKENCVVYTENTACGSCSEHCPTQAVKMIPYKGNLTIPETDNSICVGCGACEYACPVVPYKAIYVDGNLIHETAQKPKTEKLEEPSMEEDFPF